MVTAAVKSTGNRSAALSTQQVRALDVSATADRFTTVNGLRFHYREYATFSTQNRPIVLLHGLASSSQIWSSVAPLLAESSRVIALDQRGHGRSDKPDNGYDFASVVGDLDAFLRELAIERPVLVGHSWGANVALEYAAKYPGWVAGLVLVDGGLDELPSRADTTWEQIEHDMAPPDLTHFTPRELVAQVKEWEWGTFWNDRVEAAVLSLFEVDERGKVRPRLSRSNHLRIVRAIWEQPLASIYPGVRCPVLILPALNTDDDEAIERKRAKVAQAEALLRDPRVRWFEETFHDVPLQSPRELAAVIGSFLSDRVVSAGSTATKNKPLAKPFADDRMTSRA